MKSSFLNKNFVKFWDSLSGENGHSYKEFVVDPAMTKLVGSFKRKSVLDLGCGNGYMGAHFVRRGASKVLLMDLSSYNLLAAKKRNPSPKVTFLRQDATKPWKLGTRTLDVIYSDMMLNEVGNIHTPIKEA